MRATWFRSMMSSLAWFTRLLQAVSFYPNTRASRCFWNCERNSSSFSVSVWNKQIFNPTFRPTSWLLQKWISYRVETFFGSCKSSTILDTFRHRRHSKITGNRWITLFFLFFFIFCVKFCWWDLFGLVVWLCVCDPPWITTASLQRECWSCGPSHASRGGALLCLLWGWVKIKFRFCFRRREIQFERIDIFLMAGRKWRKPRN